MSFTKNYFFILLVSIIPFIGIFCTADLPHTSDGGVHLPRIAAYYKALHDGHFPVRWAGDLNYGYGLPLFNFMYHTPYLIGSLLLTAGLNLIVSFKLILLCSFLLSGVFMYGFTREFFRNDRQALLVTIFYQFAPFRLVEIFVRGSLGSLYAYAFLPAVLWSLTKILRRPSPVHLVLTAGATTLLIISHNSLSLVFFLLSGLFAIFLGTNHKNLFWCLLSLFWGIGLSAFYWLPAVWEHHYTYGDLFMREMYRDHFPRLFNFFIPNFTNDAKWRVAEVAVQFGFFHVLAIVATLILVFKRQQLERQLKRLFLFALLILGGALFFMQPVSTFFWQRLSLLRQFQFPWRLLAIPVLATSLLSSSFYFFKCLNKMLTYGGLILLTIISTAIYWRPPQGFDRVREADFWNYPLNTTYFGETDVIWSAGPANQYPQNRIEIIAGDGTISNFNKTTTTHAFNLNAATAVRLVDHTQYFPGWRVYLNGKKIPVEFQDQNWRGLITFTAPAGKSQVKVIFAESPLRLGANLISLLGVLAIIPTLLVAQRNYESSRSH